MSSKAAFLSQYASKATKKEKKEKKEKKSKKVGGAKDLSKYTSSFHDNDDKFGSKWEEEEEETPWGSMGFSGGQDDEEGPVVVDDAGVAAAGNVGVGSKAAKASQDDVEVKAAKPARKRIGSEDSDEPPRRRARVDSEGSEPPRRTARKDSDASADSPPRRKARKDSDASVGSPPRRSKRRADSDASAGSPPRRKTARADSDSDDSDSPPRRTKDGKDAKGRMTQMASGHSAGLQTGSQFQVKENALKLAKERELAEMTKSMSGQQQTTYRDKSGKVMDLGTHLQEQEEIEKAAKRKEEQELKEFRKGTKQKEEEAARRKEMELLASEGLARHVGDSRLEAQLKSEMRMDDPMAKYMAKKIMAEEDAAGVVRKKVYRGPPGPPNRYGIKPGYRWDGVDRGNGFEAKVLAKFAGRGLRAEQSYKWSSSDM
jgi:pre-mRNA-splicing factor CWC26